MLRCLMLFVALFSLALPVAVPAGEQPHIRKPADRLIGTWHSAQGELTFRPDGIVVYRGHRHHYAAGNGVIQIKYRHVIRQLPYKIFDGKLTITDNGTDTVYMRE